MTRKTDIETLAKTIWGEARGEGDLGMRAVAHVILNRLAVARHMPGFWGWPDSITGICLQPWQFSVWNENDPNRKKLDTITADNPFYRKAYNVAMDAMDGHLGKDPTAGATHYLNPGAVHIMPNWTNGDPLAVIGKHHFYRPDGVPDLKKNNEFPENTVYFPEQPDNEPVGQSVDGHTLYRLRRPYLYTWTGPDKKDRSIFIKAGLIYDGASVPRLAWTFSGLTPDGTHRAASLVHDYLYIYRGKLPEGSYLRRDNGEWVALIAEWPRKQADKIFARIMRESGVPSHRRKLAYIAVRAGGWAAWRT